MAKNNVELTHEEELLVLLYWAYGRDLEAKLGRDRIRAIPSLRKAVEASARLPNAIGWGGESFTMPTRGQHPGRERRLRQD